MRKFNRERLKERIKNHSLYKRAVESKRFLLFLMVLIILVSYNYFSQGFIYDLANNNLDDTINFIGSFGDLSWLVYISIIIIEVILAPMPGFVLASASGIIFSPFFGGFFTLIGNIIGASIAYFLARRYAGFYFIRLINDKKLTSFKKYSEKYGPLVLFILRLNPITSSDIFSYLAGVINMSYKKFIISTTLGLLPGIFVLSYFGELFIKESPFLRLSFLIITLIYILIFLYGYYKIGKEKFKDGIKKFRK